MRLAEHLTALRTWCKQCLPGWVKIRHAPSRHSRDARVYGHTTTAMHKLSTPPPPPPSHFYFPASGQGVVTGVVPFFFPRFFPSMFIAHRVQQSHCSSTFHRVLLTHALALSASQVVHKKKSPRMYTSMPSGGLELTELTYTRLEDNLIRHRGDRVRCITCRRFYPGLPGFLPGENRGELANGYEYEYTYPFFFSPPIPTRPLPPLPPSRPPFDQNQAPTSLKTPPSPHRIFDLQDSLDDLMHFLPQLSDFVPLRNGFYSFRAQTA